MKRLLLVLLVSAIASKIAAQQNWAAIPCSKLGPLDGINKMFVDSLHNEIILYSLNGHSICNTTYKGIFGYNGSTFRDLDYGINKHRPAQGTQGTTVNGCITFGNKTLFGGGFLSVGSDTLYAKSIALWNGTIWDTFPIHVFDNTPNFSSGGGFAGFLRWNGKLFLYGGFDTIGNTVTKNIAAYDGGTFTVVPAIPVSNPATITNMIVYKNKLIATGNFYDLTSFNMFRLAQFDGTNWASVGNGVQGGLSACQAMAVYKDTLYIAGAFPKSAGNAGNNIMKWEGSQLRDAGFGDFCGYGAIWSLIPFKNRLYAFGGFGCAANQKAFGMAYYENGAWTVSQDSVDNLITSAVLYDDAIYIGGGFKSMNGDTTIQKFAKLVCPDFDAASGCISGVSEHALDTKVKMFPTPTDNIVTVRIDLQGDKQIRLVDATGRLLFVARKWDKQFDIDLSGYTKGIYFLYIKTEAGLATRKILKE